ncbi:hypothetical protein ACHAWT_003219 [Skeletonema menzelii]
MLPLPPSITGCNLDDQQQHEVSLLEESDHALLTDYFYYIFLQLSICRLTEKDRKTRVGKRQDVTIGYGGLQCIHCATSSTSGRKFFWSNVDRLANSFAVIPDHVLTCKMCPKDVVDSLLVLKGRHSVQMSNLMRGSQKRFFRKMWKRLHAGDGGGGGGGDTIVAAANTACASLKGGSSTTITTADVEFQSPPPFDSDAAADEMLKKCVTQSPNDDEERSPQDNTTQGEEEEDNIGLVYIPV